MILLFTVLKLVIKEVRKIKANKAEKKKIVKMKLVMVVKIFCQVPTVPCFIKGTYSN